MKRYRKGQVFRPPTAAESAANADALEGFRSRPAEPQPRLTRGAKILVKTHTDGIDARVGTTISSAICLKLVETSTSEEKTLLETDEEIEVFNLELAPVAGDIYVQTGLTVHGTRCVELSQEELQKFQIVGDHPGKSIVFDCYLGTWDPATDAYIFDCGTTFKGIDHYNGVPFPTDYPQGHGIWKPSDTYAKIIDVVAMDCEGPGIDCPA